MGATAQGRPRTTTTFRDEGPSPTFDEGPSPAPSAFAARRGLGGVIHVGGVAAATHSTALRELLEAPVPLHLWLLVHDAPWRLLASCPVRRRRTRNSALRTFTPRTLCQ